METKNIDFMSTCGKRKKRKTAATTPKTKRRSGPKEYSIQATYSRNPKKSLKSKGAIVVKSSQIDKFEKNEYVYDAVVEAPSKAAVERWLKSSSYLKRKDVSLIDR